MKFWSSISKRKLTARDEREIQYINADLLRKVVYFEWILIVICAMGEYAVLSQDVQHNSPAILNHPLANWTVSLIFMFLVFLLSFVNPARSSYWDRMCFLFLEIVSITGGAVSGFSKFVFPIYMVSVAKASLILDRPGQVIIFVTALITQLANGCFQYYLINTWVQKNPLYIGAIFGMLAASLIDNYAAITMMVLVGIVTVTLVAEQKARLDAERLSREVKNLATELERTRIAQEIHDSLGHTLTSLNIQLEVARKFSDRDAKRSHDALETAKQLASQSLTDVRTAIQSIRHPDFDLAEAVNSLAKNMQQNQTLEITVDINSQDISAAVGYQLFRIIQECLTNVMKHAEASEVKVKLRRNGKRIELCVADNGKGLPGVSKSGGFGIKGMQERVESMHGTVEIESQPGQGTSLQVIIPL